MGSQVPMDGGGRSLLFLALDGCSLDPDLARTLAPLAPVVLDLDPWPWERPERLLDDLGRRFSRRPLLGLTPRPLRDGTVPLRGLSRLGAGLALASSRGLEPEAFRGVVLHEVAHALGLEHCAGPACALEERPWPLSIEDRPAALCPPCHEAWLRRCGP